MYAKIDVVRGYQKEKNLNERWWIERKEKKETKKKLIRIVILLISRQLKTGLLIN